MVTTKVKIVVMYNVCYYIDGICKEQPMINKPYSICKWFVNQNKQYYKNGLLTIERVK